MQTAQREVQNAGRWYPASVRLLEGVVAKLDSSPYTLTQPTTSVARNVRYQEDLVDQLFNSSEKRLARALFLLAHFGKDGKPEVAIPKISQETLAEMCGHDPLADQLVHEQVQEVGLPSLQQ
jgi:hypothetical protein